MSIWRRNPKSRNLRKQKKRIAALNDEMEKLESQQVDAAMQRADLEQSQEKAKALEEGITDAQARQKELEEIIAAMTAIWPSAKPRGDRGERRFPAFKSFMSLKSWGVRTTLETGAFESNLFLKVE